MSLARCIYNCEDNGDCEDACVAQFKGRTEDCPCEVSIILYEPYFMILAANANIME